MATSYAIYSYDHRGWFSKVTETFVPKRGPECEYADPAFAHVQANKLLATLGFSTQLEIRQTPN